MSQVSPRILQAEAFRASLIASRHQSTEEKRAIYLPENDDVQESPKYTRQRDIIRQACRTEDLRQAFEAELKSDDGFPTLHEMIAPEEVGRPRVHTVNSTFFDAAKRYRSLGWEVIPMGKGKKPLVTWKPFTKGKSASEAELKMWFGWRSVVGLAAVLGPASEGLACRDFDSMKAYEIWASNHSDLAGTLPTALSSRGAHVFFRHEHRRSTEYYSDGELRINGLIILAPSRHDSGCIYEWALPPQRENLQVLDNLEDCGLIGRATERAEKTKKTETAENPKRPEKSERTNEIKNNIPVSREPVTLVTVDDQIRTIIEATQPTGPGQRHHKVFALSRHLKSLPQFRDADPRQFREAVRAWHEKAKPHITTKAFEESWYDFVKGWPLIRHEIGQNPVEIASADLDDIPPEAASYEETRIGQLAGLCRRLQQNVGDACFFLSCRKAAEILNVDHASTARWLDLLVMDGLLELVEKGHQSGNRRRASRYRYLGKWRDDPAPIDSVQ